MSIIGNYTQISGGWVPEYRYNGIAGAVYREKRMIDTRVYEAHVSDDHVITSTPANPDNLQSPWQCESIGWDAPYGQPLQKTIREVWVNKSAPWEAD